MAFNNENVAYLENADFDSQGNFIHENSAPMLIMIYGNACPHCHHAMPEFIKLTHNYPKAMYAAICTDGSDADSQLLSRLTSFIPNLQGVPTFVLYRNGKYIKSQTGMRNATELQAFLTS